MSRDSRALRPIAVASLSTGARSVSASPPSEQTLGALLASLGREHAERDAILFRDKRISYGELDASAASAARALLAMGIRRGDRIAALLPNRPEWLVTFLGAARIGAVFVPLNTWYKRDELAHALRDSGARLLVFVPTFLRQEFGRWLAELVPELAEHEGSELRSRRLPNLRVLVSVDSEHRGGVGWEDFLNGGRDVHGGTAARARAAVGPRDAALVLYTSGSSGAPKAVLLDHGGIVGNGRAIGDRRWIAHGDRFWIGSPLFYALAAVNALPAALTHAAAVAFEQTFDPESALKTIESNQCNVYYGTSNMTHALVTHSDFARRRTHSLKKGSLGIQQRLRHAVLTELGASLATPSYGLTETYGNCTGGRPDDPPDVKISTEGTPLPGFELRIADPATRETLPSGSVGHVLVRGYVADAAHDASLLDADGWFDTGDLGSLDRSGSLRFYARAKELIKTGGINVSPLEVERLLTRHPSIREAYVVGIGDEAKGEVVAAVCVRGAPVSEEEVQEFVREHASGFKVPQLVFFRSAASLPRVASGKVPRYVLREEIERELGR
jgi:fatty-acyl-CoA synthase